MSKFGYRTIDLLALGVRRETKAGASATPQPGMLAEINSGGRLIAHAVAGGIATSNWVTEQDFTGSTIDTNYSASQLVQHSFIPAGGEVFALLHTTQTIAIGNYLESAGNGRLREHVAATFAATTSAQVVINRIVAQALEAITNTTTAGIRIKVRVV